MLNEKNKEYINLENIKIFFMFLKIDFKNIFQNKNQTSSKLPMKLLKFLSLVSN